MTSEIIIQLSDIYVNDLSKNGMRHFFVESGDFFLAKERFFCYNKLYKHVGFSCRAAVVVK